MFSEAQSWFVLAGCVFFLMGVSLWGDASSQELAELKRAYRWAGVFFTMAGAGLLGGALLAPAMLETWLRPRALDRPARLVGAAALLLAGLGMAASQLWTTGQYGLSARLEARLGLEPPAERQGQKLARWSRRLLGLILVLFAVRLLRADLP